MRTTLSFGFQRIIICLLALGVMGSAALASPMYAGTTLNVNGTTYTWVGDYDDGDYHFDFYQDSSSNPLTVYGTNWNSSLAVVTDGPGGYIISGTYTPGSVNTTAAGSYTQMGYSFTNYDSTTTYTINIDSGTYSTNNYTTYSGPLGYYSVYTDDYGGVTWSLAVASNDTSTTTPSSGDSTPSVFGLNFTFDHSDYGYTVNSNFLGIDGVYDVETSYWTDHYNGPDGATLTIFWTIAQENTWANISCHASLWSPFIGTIETFDYPGAYPGLYNMSWQSRTAPKFAPAQIWVKAKGAPESTRKLLYWEAAQITSAGRIIDTYYRTMDDPGVTIEGGPEGGNAVTVNEAANGTYASETGFTNTGDYEILTADDGMNAWISSTPFFSTATSLWVDGTEYPFLQGYRDASGTRVDVYENPSAGTVTLVGDSSDATFADVQVSHMGVGEDGYYDDGEFITYLFLVTTSATDPVYGPLAWWVDGRLLTRSAPGSTTFTSGADTITVTSSDSGATLDLTGTLGSVSITGSISGTAAGLVFMENTAVTGTTVAVARANADGSLILGTGEPPEDFPPAVMALSQGLWRFLASATNGGVTTAWYAQSDATGFLEPADARAWLLAVDSTGAATLTNLVTDEAYAGTYSTTTHLFQTTAGEGALPFRLIAADSTNGAAWGLGELPAGLPPSLRVRGQPWWYAGTDGNGVSTYLGFYSGQSMTVGPLENGARAVTLIDPVYNAGAANPNDATHGSLSNTRGSARLRDGTLVTTGGDSGEAAPATPVDNYQVYTIGSDLDVVGNNLSFGVLPDDASISGALFQFAGTSTTATLHSILSKPQARWGWWQAGATESDAPKPVMWLDETHKLKLYPSASATVPGIVLDPEGPSSFKNSVRVPAGGDIPMGAYQEGGEP